jgi:voltage-gated potassium channel
MGLFRRILIALGLLAFVLVAGTVGFKLLVGGTWLDGFYMTVITISTVGFGEVVPGLEESPAGRLFTVLLILSGMGILLYVLSATTAFFVEGQLTDMLRRRKMDKMIANLSNHFIVCGTGTTGHWVVEEMAAVGESFVVIETVEPRIQRMAAEVTFPYIVGDATEEEILVKAGVHKARGVVTLLPSDKDNLFVTFTARQLNPGVRIVARGVEPGIRERLLKAGADVVVFPNRIGALRMVSEMVRPHVVSFLDRMLRPGPETWRVEQVDISGGSPSVGKTLGALKIQEKIGIPVLALSEDGGEKVTYYPSLETVLQENTQLVVLAERAQVEKLRRLVGAGS